MIDAINIVLNEFFSWRWTDTAAIILIVALSFFLIWVYEKHSM